MTEPHLAAEESEPEREALPPSMRDRIPFLLYRAAEHSHSLANDMLARAELTARQVGILTLVIEREPMTQKALGDLLRIDRTTMVALIDDLEGGLADRVWPGGQGAGNRNPRRAAAPLPGPADGRGATAPRGAAEAPSAPARAPRDAGLAARSAQVMTGGDILGG